MDIDLPWMVDFSKIAVSLVLLLIMGLQDLKTREISNIAVYAYLGSSFLLFVLTLFTNAPPPPLSIIYAILSLVITAGLFTLLYLYGLVGDGDVFVSFALGLMFAYPSVYNATIYSSGIMPPSIAVVFYSALVGILLIIANAIYVFVFHREVLKSIPKPYMLILPFIGKPIKVRDYLEGRVKHHFIVQDFHVKDNELNIEYKFFINVYEDVTKKIRDLLERGMLNPDSYVWVTPGLPFIFHFFIGVLVFVILGDKPIMLLLSLLVS